MKRLLIIGAGYGQLPAIERAREMGVQSICIDINPDAIGMKLCDHAYVVDVLDFEGAIEIARKYKVSGVITLQSDLPVPTIGYINEQLGLTGVSLKAAIDCSNKISTRKRLAVFGCQQPEFRVANDVLSAQAAAKEIGFPCIIKAPDSSGSRGVLKVEAEQYIETAFYEANSYSRGKEILVEEYIEGLEFGAQTFSVGGECKVVLLHNDTISSPPYMIPVGHSFPFKFLKKSERDLAIADIQKAVLALGINDGPSNVDLILDKKNNRIKIIEIGARVGATCLPELVQYFTGIDWVAATIKSAMGEVPNLKINKEQPVAAFILQSPKDGKLVSFETPEMVLPELLELEITANEGQMVSRLRKGTDRIGKVICKGDTADDAEKRALEILQRINFVIDG